MTSRRASEEGTITLWVLGLSLLLLSVGALSLDLWHVLSERRALVGIADAAAWAGASGIDEAHYRGTGEVVLDDPRARQMAAASLASQLDARALRDSHIEVTATSLTVTIAGAVDTTLLDLLAPGVDVLDFTVSASAEPHLS